MCCLFGMIDLHHTFTRKQKTKILRILSAACEARGTDAAGVAYNSHGHLQIYKRPVPAHQLHLRIPDDVSVVMGHTRMTTQGCEQLNWNNHPFRGMTNGQSFALAHNGVLRNDKQLRTAQKLPATNIETDSFIAVQLIQKYGALSLDSLKHMVEQLEGSFSFTVLDSKNNLYFIKGDNPLCIYYYPESGVYLYASTQEILDAALSKIHLLREMPRRILLDCGDILKVSADGSHEVAVFDTSKLFTCSWLWDYWPRFSLSRQSASVQTSAHQEYVQQLRSTASYFGYDPGSVDLMLADGFSLDDVESMLYAGEL